MTAAAPSWVVTFLLTGVTGLTSRWEADAEGMSCTGDGIRAAFTSPEYVVDAAVAIK